MTDAIIKTITEITGDKVYILTMPAPIHFIMVDLHSKVKALGQETSFLYIYYEVLPVELKQKIKLEVKERIIN